MGGLWLSVEMVSTLYIQLWHGEIGHSVRLWNLHGRQMENTLLKKAHQRLRFSVKISRFVYMSSEMLEATDFFSLLISCHFCWKAGCQFHFLQKKL